jgi:hypothetical protein
MTEGSKWTPGKIFLLILGILAGLGLLCCGAGWLLMGDKIKAGFAFATDVKEFEKSVRTEFGPTAAFDLRDGGNAQFTLLIGVDGELTPQRVTEVQDRAWKLFGEHFAKNGFFHVEEVGVGHPTSGKKRQGKGVKDWRGNVVATSELIKRTGVAEPPIPNFLPDDVKMQISGHSEDEDEAADDEAPDDKEKPSDGAGGK